MTEVEVSVDIARPLAEVFAYITHFPNNTQWQMGVKSAEITSTGEFGIGSTYTQISQFIGRDIVFHFEVIEFEPNRRIRFKTTSGTFPVDIVRAVEPIDNETRVTAIIGGDAGGIFRLAAPLLDWMTRRQIEADYQRLKAILEA